MHAGAHAVLEYDAGVAGHAIEAGNFEFAPISIGDNVRLGCNSRLMPGTSLAMASMLEHQR
jgi:acetyltransferase-like isoleucine patch superfamily enzyme